MRVWTSLPLVAPMSRPSSPSSPLIPHQSFLISHFSFLISHFSFLISYFSSLLSPLSLYPLSSIPLSSALILNLLLLFHPFLSPCPPPSHSYISLIPIHMQLGRAPSSTAGSCTSSKKERDLGSTINIDISLWRSETASPLMPLGTEHDHWVSPRFVSPSSWTHNFISSAYVTNKPINWLLLSSFSSSFAFQAEFDGGSSIWGDHEEPPDGHPWPHPPRLHPRCLPAQYGRHQDGWGQASGVRHVARLCRRCLLLPIISLGL